MTPTVSNAPTEAAPPGRAPSTGSSANRRRVLGLLREFALIPPLILVIIVGAALEPVFATTDNFSNILQQSSELAIVVLAESLILIAGKFDLSFESTFGFAGWSVRGSWCQGATPTAPGCCTVRRWVSSSPSPRACWSAS